MVNQIKQLSYFLEDIENDKRYLKESITPRDLSDLSELIDQMGFENFLLSLLHIIQREDAPVKDSEAVADYLKEILRSQGKSI